MTQSGLSRREFLRRVAVTASGVALVACGSAPQAQAPAATEAAAPTEAPALPTEAPPPTTAPAPADATTIGWWQGDSLEYQDAYKQMTARFNETNPTIKVEVQNVPGGGFDEKLLTMIAAGEGPDVWMAIPAVETPRHGYMENLDEYVKQDGLDPDSLWFDIAVKRGLWDGKRFGVPRDVGFAAFAYNKDLFDAASVPYPQDGWTLDDFVTTAKALTNPEKGTWGTDAGGSGALMWGTAALPFNMGFKLLSEDGRTIKGYLDTPESIAAIQYILDMEVEHKAAVTGEQLEALGGLAFVSGKVGIGTVSTWDLASLKSIPFKWGLVQPPVKAGQQPHSWGGAVQYYMWSGGKNKPAAWELMKFISSPEGSKIPHDLATWTSPCSQVWQETGAENDPILGWFLKQADLPTELPPYELSEKFWDCAGPEFTGIWTRYIENEERPLDTIVKDAAAKAQTCSDDAYANE